MVFVNGVLASPPGLPPSHLNVLLSAWSLAVLISRVVHFLLVAVLSMHYDSILFFTFVDISSHSLVHVSSSIADVSCRGIFPVSLFQSH